MRFLLPPTEGIRNSKGKGVQEEAISKGMWLDSEGLFSRDFETRIIIDDLTLQGPRRPFKVVGLKNLANARNIKFSVLPFILFTTSTNIT